MQISLIQKKHLLGNKKKNLKKIEDTVYDLGDSDLIIFPEMFLTGYTLRDKLWNEAEEIPGPSTEFISELSVDTDSTIICGMPEKVKGKGRLRNSAVITKPDGDINVYRKTYLPNFGPFEEKRYFEGDNELTIVDTDHGKLGLLICYDIFFPELSKSYALKGVDMIACISASPSTTRKYFEKVLPARAIETTSFIFYANLVAREDNIVFWGGDTIVSPKGDVIAKGSYFEEEIVTKKIDLKDIDKARRGRPVLSDTRPEMMYESADSSLK